MRITQAPGKAAAAALAGILASMLAGPVLIGTVLAGPAAAASGTAQPAPRPSRPPAGRAPAVPQLTISISDGRKSVQAGERLTYTVLVSNGGGREQHLKITQTLPPGLRLVSANRSGLASRNLVTWRSGVPARGTQTFRLTAQVIRTPARVTQLASIACAAAGSVRPLVCAAAMNRIPASAAAVATRRGRPSGGGSSGWAAVGWVFLAVLAVGLVLLAGLRARSRRGLRGAS